MLTSQYYRLNLDEFHHKRTCSVVGHEDQHFSFYCNSKGCDLPICSLCAVTEHDKADGHDIRNINDVYLENKRVIGELGGICMHCENVLMSVARVHIHSGSDNVFDIKLKINCINNK